MAKKRKIRLTFESWFDELVELTARLSADTERCLKESSKIETENEDEQFWRRMFIRGLFAQIEGQLFCMKQIAVEFHTEDGLIAVGDRATVALLLEERYELKDKSEVEFHEKFPTLSTNMPFAFREFARVFDVVFTVALDHSLINAEKVRHRITHPKSIKDMEISDDDFSIVKAAMDWFTKEHRKLIESVNEKMMLDLTGPTTH